MWPNKAQWDVTGSLRFTDENGEVHEFEIEGMNSIHAACNKINRMFCMGNSMDDFIKQRVVVTKNSDDVVKGTILFAEFNAWMAKNGSNYDGGRNSLYKEVAMLNGVRRVTGKNVIAFRGIKLTFGDQRLDNLENDDDLI